jgi:hypothetical protein
LSNEENKAKKLKKPWPTKKAMEQVYVNKLWGDNKSDFYSGSGSHLPEIVNPYVTTLTSFLCSFEKTLTVCDLGCGDFNVGKELVKHTEKYIAIDIVPDLITRNQEKFQEANLEFHCLDIAVDDLPAADCALVRQVLQHLSNTAIQSILKKLGAYKYVVLTEHIPEGNFTPNKDIISGQGTRLKKQSGLNLLATPFHFQVIEEKHLLTVTPPNKLGLIVTTLYTIN